MPSETRPALDRSDSAWSDIKYFVRRHGAAIVVLAFAALFLWRVRAQLPPFIAAIILAILIEPVMQWLTRRGMSRWWGAFLIVLVSLIIIGALAIVLIQLAATQMSQAVSDADRYRTALLEFADGLSRWWSNMIAALGLPTKYSKPLTDIGPWLSTQIGHLAGAVQGLLSSFVSKIGIFISKIVWIIIVPIATFYLMADGPRARHKILACLSDENQARAKDLAQQIGSVFAGYVRGVITVSALYGFAMTIVFVALGLEEYAIAVGTIAAVFYIVPYVGPTATLVVAIAVAFIARDASWLHSWSIVVAAAGVLGFNLAFDNLVFPKIVGGSVKLHPLVAIFAMFTGYAMMGIGGMILAIPLAASIQVVLVYMFPALVKPEPAATQPPYPRVAPSPASVPSGAPSIATAPSIESSQANRPPRSGRPRRRRGPRRRPPEGGGPPPQGHNRDPREPREPRDRPPRGNSTP